MQGKGITNPAGGRPTVMTEQVIAKLEQAFLVSASDKQACLWAGIHPATLYKYQVANPEFIERKELLKEQTTLKAKMVVANAVDEGDKGQANWHLERKAKNEYGTRSENVNVNIDVKELPDEDKDRLKDLLGNT